MKLATPSAVPFSVSECRHSSAWYTSQDRPPPGTDTGEDTRTPGALQVWVHGDAHDAGAREARELRVLELLAQGPGYEVAARQLPVGQAGQRGGAANGALQCDLNHRQHVRQRVLRTQGRQV